MNPSNPQALYLNLLKQTLSYALWDEPPIPITTFIHMHSPFRRFLIRSVANFLDKKNLQLGKKRNISEEQRTEGEVWPGCAHTMIGLKRLDNLQYCVETVLKNGVDGDLIETGVWRGGACIFMRGLLAAYGIEDRRVFVADSFEGLPKPDPEKYPVDTGDQFHLNTYLSVSEEEVANNFKKYGLLDEQVVFLKGWFKDTLPHAKIQKLSILRLDGDMYSSTTEALEALYPKLAIGGFCIIDDYELPNCQSAVRDYLAKHNLKTQIERIDTGSSYWKKE